MAQSVLDIALRIAASGLPVFPCGRTKKPCIGKKDGGRGFHDAVIDPVAVRALFGRCKASLVGVPTGTFSGLDVLDFDYRHGATEWETANAHRLPATRAHQTQSGGRHLVFRHVAGVRNLASTFAPGMDVRGEGGYIIMPPSTGYSVIDESDIGEWPDWLLATVLRADPAKAERDPAAPVIKLTSKRLDGLKDSILARVRSAADGQKHYVLRNAALSLGGIQEAAGFSDSEAIRMLVDALPHSALDLGLARETAAWGLEHGRLKPIELPDREQYQRNGHAPGYMNGHDADPPPFDPPPGSEDDYGIEEPQPRRKAPTSPLPPDEAPVIRVINGFLDKISTQGEAALIQSGLPIYQRGRSLVRPVRSEVPASKGRTTIAAGLAEIGSAAMVDRLCRAARWEKYDGRAKAWLRIDPPDKVAVIILSRVGDWKFAAVAGVITTPTLRPDGSLLTAAGYDAQTRLYHVADAGLLGMDLIERPTRADAEAALADLQHLLTNFPTVTEIDHSVALSGIITPVVRGALSVVPMHAYRASTAGTGKTYLVDVASVIATGRACPVVTVAKTEEETEKRLGGLLLAAFPLICLDNVNGELGGDLLCQAIERPIVQVRPLGTSDMVEIESRASVYATGNALRVRGDMTRRTLVGNLDAGVERPELRKFEFDPVEEVLSDRRRYVSACLVIVLAHANAGFPGMEGIVPLASFQDWSKYVRCALIWLGCADPCASMEDAREDDPELSDLRELLAGWKSEIGTVSAHTTGEICGMINDRIDGEGSAYKYQILREFVLRVAVGRNGADSRKFGVYLKNRGGRIVDKMRLRVAGTANGGVSRWQLQQVG